MSSGYFSVGIYGQSGLVMDWYGLNDPFIQQIPVKITNNWSGTIWVQGELINPPTGVYTAYSGVSMSGVSAGASAIAIMTWNVNVSGQTATSSPVTHALTLGFLAFTSSNYTGALASGNFAINNTLFSRWSGVMKLVGESFNHDVPVPSISQTAGGSLGSGTVYAYGLSYFLSGWESETGVFNTITINSGFGSAVLSWTWLPKVTQYAVWRHSGTTIGPITGSGVVISSGQILDLLAIVSGVSFTDSGAAVLGSGFWRQTEIARGHNLPTAKFADVLSTATYLSPPSSEQLTMSSASSTLPGTGLFAIAVQLNKNISGVSLSGPAYATFHIQYVSPNTQTTLEVGSADIATSGTTLVDDSIVSATPKNMWMRYCFILPQAGTTNSGYAYFGIVLGMPNQTGNTQAFLDDVFIVSVS